MLQHFDMSNVKVWFLNIYFQSQQKPLPKPIKSMQPNSDDFISVNMLTAQQQNKHVRRESIKQLGGGVNAAGFIWKKMFIFRKIWHALISWNTHFEICPFALLPTLYVNFNSFFLVPLVTYKWFICSDWEHIFYLYSLYDVSF